MRTTSLLSSVVISCILLVFSGKTVAIAGADAENQAYLNQPKQDIVGTNKNPNTWIYRLGENGVMVREVEIESGRPGKPVTIVQLTDCHFNYCDAKDLEEKNPTLMSTLQNRKWLANASSVGNAEKSLEYAKMAGADQIIVTGDVLDYLSHGCVELLKKVVWEKYPGAIVTAGNHDWVQQMQGTVGETLSFEERRKTLEEIWAPHHDLYYHSKMVGDKIMVIQMENGTGKFWDCQVAPFKADIEKARKEGYKLLLFYHIQLATANPAEKDLYPLRRNDSNNTNFCDGQGCAAGPNSKGASKQIYDLIANNADIIKGCFCGHWHSDYYTEIQAKTKDGTAAIIPQYILTATAYDSGHALKITVK